MPAPADFEAEIDRLVQRYYDIADSVSAASAAGCEMLRADPFAQPARQEAELRSRILRG